MSIQIFKVQNNVQGIQRLVDKLGGSADGTPLRTSLSVLYTCVNHTARLTL